jgi:hypothetical protein
MSTTDLKTDGKKPAPYIVPFRKKSAADNLESSKKTVPVKLPNDSK